jgi:hypothetical protein
VQRAIAASSDNSATAVELELISILDGPAFRTSPRSRGFLRFVVEETLAGREDSLKERTVGIAVMGKSSDYDTGSDSAVRVRANDVRKRLATHYEASKPRAGIRIELPTGTYAPRFRAVAAPAPKAVRSNQPPPMRLWQLAAPTLCAAFFALLAIRGGVESSDAYSRFWNQTLAGRSEIAIVVDAGPSGSISPAMADAALPLEALATAYHTQVHLIAEGERVPHGACMIRLSLDRKPAERAEFRIDGAKVFRAHDGGAALWLWAENAGALRQATTSLSSRTGFPQLP